VVAGGIVVVVVVVDVVVLVEVVDGAEPAAAAERSARGGSPAPRPWYTRAVAEVAAMATAKPPPTIALRSPVRNISTSPACSVDRFLPSASALRRRP
jgi:hypothetical protein